MRIDPKLFKAAPYSERGEELPLYYEGRAEHYLAHRPELQFSSHRGDVFGNEKRCEAAARASTRPSTRAA